MSGPIQKAVIIVPIPIFLIFEISPERSALAPPLINFFNKYVSAKIFNVDYEKISKDVAFFMLKGAMVKNSVPNHTKRTRFNNDSTTAEVLSESTRL